MELLLQREASTPQSTPGVLYLNGNRLCYTLEDVVREIPLTPVSEWKIAGKTAIPKGAYRVVIDTSQRFGRLMPHVLEVPGFTGIRIHSGNIAAQTEGCILVGRVRNGWDTILESRTAFRQLYAKLKAALDANEEITLTILNAVPIPQTGVA